LIFKEIDSGPQRRREKFCVIC